jgi:NADH-quinone oxidoreductase subunit J
MTFQQILFIIFSVITLGAALMVVTKRNVFHAALFMVLAFFGIAVLYVLLEAPFLAAVQLFIYIGGISILIIFAIMLTKDMMDPALVGRNSQWIGAALLAVILCAVLVWAVWDQGWAVAAPGPVPEDSIAILGNTLVDAEGLALPFEVASVLLLAALIGAVTIARER